MTKTPKKPTNPMNFAGVKKYDKELRSLIKKIWENEYLNV